MKNTILVVEDEATTRNILQDHLAGAGYDVRVAADGEEAIHTVRREKIDLVVLDLLMPKVKGFDVLEYIKKDFPSIKVIVLTAYADLRNAMESKRFGADDFIGKPYEYEDILGSIERLLSA